MELTEEKKKYWGREKRKRETKEMIGQWIIRHDDEEGRRRRKERGERETDRQLMPTMTTRVADDAFFFR